MGTSGQKHFKPSEIRLGSRDTHREGQTEERQAEGVEGTGDDIDSRTAEGVE